MLCRHFKVTLQFLICDDIRHILRDRHGDIVIDFVAGLLISVERRYQKDRKQDKEHREDFDDPFGKSTSTRDERSVSAFLKRLIEYQDQGRKYGHASDHTDDNAFCHDQTEVTSHGETHEAKSDESCDRCDGTSDNAAERLADRDHHRFFIIGVFLSLFVIAVPQEDGIVHGDRQLKNSGECFCNIGDLAEEDITSEVKDDHHADGKKEYDRGEETVQQEHHGDKCQRDRDRHIDWLFFLAQFLEVGDQCGHAGDETLFIRDFSDARNGLHRLIRRSGCIVEDGHDGRVIGIKCIVQFLRQHLHRDRQIKDRIVPDDRLDVLDLCDLLFQRSHLKRRHILYDDE